MAAAAAAGAAATAAAATTAATTAGGWTDVSTTGLTSDPTFTKISNFGISQIGTAIPSLDGGNWEIAQIYSVQTQVVAGLNYKIQCQVKNAQGETQDVTMVVYFQPWTGALQLVSATEGTNTEFASIGGWKNLSGDQLSVTENKILAGAIQTAMESLASSETGFTSQGWTVQKIVSVQTQVVAGLNYKIVVELVNTQGQTQQQQWVVYCQPWSNTYTLTSSEVLGN